MAIRFTPRFTSGCFTCKRRKKKCDEHKPHCLRCTKGGFECEGYPTFDDRIRRVTFDSPTNTGPEQSSSRTKPSKVLIDSTPAIPLKEKSELPAPLTLSEGSLDLVKTSSSGCITSSVGSKVLTLRNDGPHEDSPESNDCLDGAHLITPDLLHEHPEAVYSPNTEPPLLPPPGPVPSSSSSLSSWRHSSIASSSTDPDPPVVLTSGQASLLGSIFSLALPLDQTPKLIEPSWSNPPSGLLHGPIWPSGAFINDEDSLLDDGDDPEDVIDVMCRSPTPDPNTQNNALPFVLQSYAHWVKFVVFEPLKVANTIRDGVIMQFSSSPDVRMRICLIANVIGKLSRTPELDQKGVSIVSMLRSNAHQNIQRFQTRGPASEREVDMQNALGVLDSMMEVVLIQRYAGPLHSVIALMEAAAPVFRRACPDPPETLVNLPNILASPGLNLQHFAATDVIVSVTNARPMFFKYDVECSPDALAQLVKGEYGLQWLHGIPDQFIVLLAWINVLNEDHGDNVDPKYIAEIESQVRGVKIQPGSSPDPAFLVLRLAVQECWRQAVYIYLYVVLCRAQADNPRVMSAVNTFVGIVDGIKPGRNADAFLFIPIMVVGAFAHRERDRDILRRRMKGLRECTNPGTAGYECLGVLEDIWRRTRVEDRPAVWLDLRVSCYKLAGI